MLKKMTAASAAPASIPRRSVLYTIIMLTDDRIEEGDYDAEGESHHPPDCGWALELRLLDSSPE